MRRFLRHRYAVALPFALLLLTTLVGGQLNSVDARGVVVDDTTDLPVAGVPVSYGVRTVVSGPDGSYHMPALPRGARLSAQKSGYSRSSAPAEASELRLLPLTITFEVSEEGAEPAKKVAFPEARQQGRTLGRGTKGGSMVVGPYPTRDVPVLVCAEGYEPKEILAKGVLIELTLKPGGKGCPPLPSPSPTVSPSPGASPSPPSSPTPPRSP